MFLYGVARICSFISHKLPLKFSYTIASLVADIIYLTWPSGRRLMKENMSHALSSQASAEEITRAARKALRNFAKYAVDFLRSPLLQLEDIENTVTIRGWENLDQALEEGKGAILVGLHLGNWDLAAAALTLRRYRLNAIIEPLKNLKVNHFVRRLRTGIGMKVIPAGQGIETIVQALRQNELLALLIDCPSHRKGVRVNFCAAPTQLPAGAATLSLRTGARVIPISLVRLPDKTFLFRIQPHIPFQPSGNLGKDVQALTQNILSSLEGTLRQYPDQWYVFQRMWPEEVAH
jgi:KDO2-lipid IV(A) lauroyltransferase